MNKVYFISYKNNILETDCCTVLKKRKKNKQTKIQKKNAK